MSGTALDFGALSQSVSRIPLLSWMKFFLLSSFSFLSARLITLNHLNKTATQACSRFQVKISALMNQNVSTFIFDGWKCCQPYYIKPFKWQQQNHTQHSRWSFESSLKFTTIENNSSSFIDENASAHILFFWSSLSLNHLAQKDRHQQQKHAEHSRYNFKLLSNTLPLSLSLSMKMFLLSPEPFGQSTATKPCSRFQVSFKLLSNFPLTPITWSDLQEQPRYYLPPDKKKFSSLPLSLPLSKLTHKLWPWLRLSWLYF